MPKLGGDGFCLIGDSGGFVDGQRLKGIHLAVKSGMLAAESIFAAALAGEPTLRPPATPTRSTSRPAGRDRSSGRAATSTRASSAAASMRMVNAALGTVTGGLGFGFFDRLPAEAGHERLRRLDTRTRRLPRRRPRSPFDGKLTFDKLADVYNSGAAHEEDQPVHLLVADTSICVDRCAREFGNPCTRFCPAAVYEMVDDSSVAAGKRLQINASNCVHCKTCDIMDPYQIIDLGAAGGRRRSELRQDVAPGRPCRLDLASRRTSHEKSRTASFALSPARGALPATELSLDRIFAQTARPDASQTAWRPDGGLLTHVVKEEAGSELRGIDPATGKVTWKLAYSDLKTAPSAPAIAPARYRWSPRSDALLFSDDSDLYLYRLADRSLSGSPRRAPRRRRPRSRPMAPV